MRRIFSDNSERTSGAGSCSFLLRDYRRLEALTRGDREPAQSEMLLHAADQVFILLQTLCTKEIGKARQFGQRYVVNRRGVPTPIGELSY